MPYCIVFGGVKSVHRKEDQSHVIIYTNAHVLMSRTTFQILFENSEMSERRVRKFEQNQNNVQF